MPEKKLHLSQAIHNSKFAECIKLIDGDYKDWIATSIFYSALHYIESNFAGRTPEEHYRIHKDRLDKVKRDGGPLGTIYGEYSALFQASLNARYMYYLDFPGFTGKLANDFFPPKEIENFFTYLDKISKVSQITRI